MPLQFKFVELTIVTDQTLEETVNEWVGQDWQLEGIRFVTTEHSKRPAMAFVSFTREAAQATADREPPRKPPPLLKVEAPPASPRPGPDELHDSPPSMVKSDDDSPAVIVAGGGTDVD
jgi:hypothetical protein